MPIVRTDPPTVALLCAALLLPGIAGCRARADVGSSGETAAPRSDAAEPIAVRSFTYDAWAQALRHVDDRGLVDYRALAADPSGLRTFARALADLSGETFASWDDDAQIAFWINAYNALTLLAIVERWPLEREGLAALVHPRGIRWIAGVWDELEWTVLGRPITLDGIEHETLRRDYAEPRIHAALVCAAMSCPPLRNEPFDGPYLDRQLDDQMHRWVNDPAVGLAIDRDAGRVRLSKIFDWYGEDFVPTDLPPRGYGDHADKIRASLAAAARYRSAADRALLEAGDYRVGDLDYDWALNEQPAP